VRGDINNADLLHDLLSRQRPCAIVNFAAESHVDSSIHGAQDFIQTNICGTFQLLQAARKYWSGMAGSEQNDYDVLIKASSVSHVASRALTLTKALRLPD